MMNEFTKFDPKGMYHYTHTAFDGLRVECYFDHQPMEPQTHWEHGCDEEITLCYATVNGVCIMSMLSEEMVEEIEILALTALEDERKNGDE